MEKKEVAVKNGGSVDAFISQALSSGASVEVLERLFSLKQKVDEENAKMAFIESMSYLQGKLPIIKKLKQGYTAPYAPLEDEVQIVGPIIKEHGFTYRWNTLQSQDSITVECIGTHVLGHSESTSMTSPIEEVVTGNSTGKATKSAPQRVASTITYLKRYTFNNLFGLQVAGEDFDGRTQKQKSLLEPKENKSKIIFLLNTLGEKTKTKSDIEIAVKNITKLPLVPENYEEIVTRLEVSVSDAREARNEQTIV